jgi:hypothetical protein
VVKANVIEVQLVDTKDEPTTPAGRLVVKPSLTHAELLLSRHRVYAPLMPKSESQSGRP